MFYCINDICHATGDCMHGDERTCPACGGTGRTYPSRMRTGLYKLLEMQGADVVFSDLELFGVEQAAERLLQYQVPRRLWPDEVEDAFDVRNAIEAGD